jgi:hypothetical protein
LIIECQQRFFSLDEDLKSTAKENKIINNFLAAIPESMITPLRIEDMRT